MSKIRLNSVDIALEFTHKTRIHALCCCKLNIYMIKKLKLLGGKCNLDSFGI